MKAYLNGLRVYHVFVYITVQSSKTLPINDNSNVNP